MTHRTSAARTVPVAALRPACRRRGAAAGNRRTERRSPAVYPSPACPHVVSLAEPQIRTLVSRTTPMALENLAGRSIAGYRLLERVGEGGTAEVYRADHRDLKPENIMYDASTHSVKLLDFGIARDAELPPEERLTRTGFFVGMLQYVAPEALSGELVDGRADIYSLAKIAYYMLTGRHPHDGRSPRELFQQLLSGKATPLSVASDRKFAPALEAAVMKGLSAQPGDRQATVGAVADELEAALAQTKDTSKSRGILGALKNIVGKRNSE